MTRPLLFIFLILVMTGCSSSDGELPVAESQVVNLLAELHLADSRMLLDETSPDSLRVNILTSYGLDEKTYDELVTFLSDNPDRLATIYSKVVDKVVEAGDSVPEGDE